MYRYLLRAHAKASGELESLLGSYPGCHFGPRSYAVWSDDTIAEVHREVRAVLGDGEMSLIVEVEGPLLTSSLNAEQQEELAEDPVYAWEKIEPESFVGSGTWLVCLETDSSELQQLVAVTLVEADESLELLPDCWLVLPGEEREDLISDLMRSVGEAGVLVAGQLKGKLKHHGLPEWVVDMLEGKA